MNIFNISKTFKDFNISNELQDQLKELGYTHPTLIQSQTLPYALDQKDIIGLAETGSGKTLSYLLPIVNSLLTDK